MHSFLQKLQQNAYSILAPLVVLAIILVGERFKFFERLENLVIDARFKHRAPHVPPLDSRIVPIAIDDLSLKELGQWPFSRRIHGELLNSIAPSTAYTPKVIAFDLLFTESKEIAADNFFADNVNKMNVVTGAFGEIQKIKESSTPVQVLENIGPTRPLLHIRGDISKIPNLKNVTLPVEPLRQKSYFGFVNAEASSSDGIRRTLQMIFKVGNKVYPSLTLETLYLFWDLTADDVEIELGKEIRLQTEEGIKRIPIDESGDFLVNYQSDNFNGMGYIDLYRLKNHIGEPYPKNLAPIKDKILLIGQNQEGLVDLGPSPLASKSPLAWIHVFTIDNILKQNFLRVIPSTWVIPFWLVLAWATLFALQNKKNAIAIGITIGLLVLYIGLGFYLFSAKNLLFPIAWPVLGFITLHAGAITLHLHSEQKSRQQIKDLFSSYIAPMVLDQLLRHPENIKLGGVRKPVCILFSDIRDFTTISEATTEEELVFQLNEYFEKMIECVNENYGTLHKYIGDAIMAVWGDIIPESDKTNARNAVRSALHMRAKLKDLNEYWKSQNRKTLKIGIGINHGEVVVGNIGATQRKEFTVIGDAVNLAARLESMTKQFHTDFVVSETIHQFLGNDFLVRTTGLIILKGKTKPVRVFEVIDDLTHRQNSISKDWVAIYERGFEFFLKQEFNDAIQEFEAAAKMMPDDYCTSIYLEESRNLLKNPPPPDWTGTLLLESK